MRWFFNKANRKITIFILATDASLRVSLLLCFLNCFGALKCACSDLFEITLMGLVGKPDFPHRNYYINLLCAQSVLSPLSFPFSELTKEYCR